MKLRTTLLAAAASCALALTAAASNQSPIDFGLGNTVHTVLPALTYEYQSNVTLTVQNNGSPDEDSTVKGILPTGSTSRLDLMGLKYDLVQFHFHTHSEHLLNGQEFPMELHLVHQREGTTNPSGLLVTGRWIIEGAENSTLASIFSNLPASGDSHSLSGFDLSALIPSTLTSYRYSGSLTTPDYNEGVHWVFLNTPLEMSAAQIQAFKTLFPSGNARDVQSIDGRTILTDVVPEPGSFGLAMMGAALLMSRARRK